MHAHKQKQEPDKIQIPTNVMFAALVKLNIFNVMMKREELRSDATGFLVASIQKKEFFWHSFKFSFEIIFWRRWFSPSESRNENSNNNLLVPQVLHMWGILLYVFVF